ncbi:MAG: hypothetical protein K0R26_1158 [Bacteroidota bacterium]|jgi:hypothetical protein|nr:hypothetical protein [Bacteroidota bacterium]
MIIRAFKSISFLTLILSRAFSQEMLLNTYNGVVHASLLEKEGNYFKYSRIGSKRIFSIHQIKVFSYKNEKGEITLVTDSAIYSNKRKFSKPYNHLKPITNKNFHSLLYDHKITISEKTFASILKNLQNTEVQDKYRVYRKRKRIRTGILILSGGFMGSGIAATLIGLSNSSGRNSYPREKRAQASRQTHLGLGLLATSTSLAACTLIINIKNHQLLRKQLLPLYNKSI